MVPPPADSSGFRPTFLWMLGTSALVLSRRQVEVEDFSHTLRSDDNTLSKEDRIKVERLSPEAFHKKFVAGAKTRNFDSVEEMWDGELRRAISLMEQKNDADQKDTHTNMSWTRDDNDDLPIDTEATWEYQQMQRQTQSFQKTWDLDEKMALAAFKQKMRTSGKMTFLPSVSVQFCSYLNFPVAGPPGLEFVAIGLSIGGSIKFDPKNKCWGMQIDVDLGLNFGAKVFGTSFDFSVSLNGNFAIGEKPPKILKDLDEKNLMHVPVGVNLEKCQSKTPWPMLKTFIKTQIINARNSNDFKKKLNEVSVKDIERYDGFVEEYTFLLGGYPYTNTELQPPFACPRMTWDMLNLKEIRPQFLESVSNLANMLVDRFSENDGKYKKADCESAWCTSGKIFRTNRGRFLAGWPSQQRREEISIEGNEDLTDEKGFKNAPMGDGRVVNFKKAIKFSPHTHDPQFWKEMAMSGANLMMRFVKDLTAIFKLYYGGDPTWSGSCQALDPKIHTSNLIKMAKYYHWSSPWAGFQQQFLKIPEKHYTIHPHMWCRSADFAIKNKDIDDDLMDLLNEEHEWDASVLQTCQTLEHEFADFNYKTQTVRWENKKLVVEENDIFQGHLYGVGGDERAPAWMGYVPPEKTADKDEFDDETRMNGLYRLVIKNEDETTSFIWVRAQKLYIARDKMISSRPECERVAFPATVMAVMPDFVRLVRNLKAKLEIMLLKINLCNDETQDHSTLLDELPEPQKTEATKLMTERICDQIQVEDKLRVMRKNALELLDFVRDTINDFDKGASWELLQNTIEKQIQISEQTTTGGDEEGERITVAGKEATLVRKTGDTATIIMDGKLTEQTVKSFVPQGKIYLFGGILWKYFPLIKSNWAAIQKNLAPAKRRDIFLQPPVVFSGSLAIMAQTVHNSFCNPGTGIFVVQIRTSWSWNSWTDEPKSQELCYYARARPGSFWVDVSRCHGIGQSWTEWRMAYVALIYAFWSEADYTKVGGLGIFGNYQNWNLYGMLMTMGAGAFGCEAGAFMSLIMPKIENNKLLGTATALGTTASPFLLAMGTAAANGAAEGASLTKIGEIFLNGLKDHGGLGGGVSDVANQIVSNNFKPMELDKIVTWVNPVPVMLILSFANYRHTDVAVWDKVKIMKKIKQPIKQGKTRKLTCSFSTAVLLIQRLVGPTVFIPGLGAASWQIVVNIELWVDLTPWAESIVNFHRFKKSRKRAALCAACVRDGKAFCDKKYALGNAWAATDDACIPANEESKNKCREKMVDHLDASGLVMRGEYYSKDSPGGAKACQKLPFQLANTKLEMDEAGKWSYVHV